MSHPCKRCGWEDRVQRLFNKKRRQCPKCRFKDYQQATHWGRVDTNKKKEICVSTWAIDQDFDAYLWDLRKLL